MALVERWTNTLVATPEPTLAQGVGRPLTVHVVGRITTPVLSFLAPAIRVIAAEQTAQALVYIDDAFSRAHITQMAADLIRVPVADSSSPMRRSVALHAALDTLARQHAVSALHLHGLVPGLAAARWLRRQADPSVAVYFSPHSSRALDRQSLARSLVAQILKLGFGRITQRAIVNMHHEAGTFSPLGKLPVQIVETPVPQVFFDTPRAEAKRPLLVSCGMDAACDAVDAYVRIAVLLNDTRLEISFNWVGHPTPSAAAAMRAAGIGQFETDSDAQRAQRLGSAWLYVASSSERGFPVRLVEAMAAGLACVALDTEANRAVIDDGVTGFLCRDLSAMLLRIGQLVDSVELRRQFGQAGRVRAQQRFSESVFHDRLQAVIGGNNPPSSGVPPATQCT